MNKEKKGFLWKEFLTGVLATAIGVGLSFAVNNMVENHKKEQARRHTAMMAIYDIDEIVRQLKEYRQKEESYFKIALYADTHQDELDDISIDSLRIATIYLIEDNSSTIPWTDDSKEKAFNGSMDAWQNLQNTQFYDNVLTCYRLRNELLRMMETELVFRRPFSDESFNDYFLKVNDTDLDYSGSLNKESLARLLRQILQQPTATRFLRTYFLRNASYIGYADKLEILNRENKVLMGITSKDIDDYIKTNVDKTRPATAKKIAGEWETGQDETRTEMFRFNPDNTVTLTSNTPFSMSYYLEEEGITVALECPISYGIDGTWEIVRDSLKMAFDPESCKLLSFEMDLSHFPKSALERQKDSLDIKRQKVKDYVLEYLKSADWSLTDKVALDITGNVMFLTSERTTSWGETETDQQQLVRK
ncbi:MAG: hypothetical protein J5695_06360 [Bacteroidales bacterium]|nr:hypothetical protein [Bacteroidales bacterium]